MQKDKGNDNNLDTSIKAADLFGCNRHIPTTTSRTDHSDILNSPTSAASTSFQESIQQIFQDNNTSANSDDSGQCSSSAQPQIQTKIFHPSATFVFPKSKHRSCQIKWFKQWQWLTYDIKKDAVFCHVCCSLVGKKLMPFSESKSESAFTIAGFSCWDKGSDKFKTHEKSAFHLKSCEKLATKCTITAMLDKSLKSEQLINRRALFIIFSAVKYLGQQCFPFRGDEHNDGSFYNLVMEMTSCDADVLFFFHKRNNWLSDNIQNEIIAQFSQTVLQR